MTIHATVEYATRPTVTTIDRTDYPLQDVDFPGIAICELNKISLSAAKKVAREIFENYDSVNDDVSLREILDMLKYLGHLYLFELNEGEENGVEFLHNLLTQRYESYAPRILNQLTPNCQSMLKRCSWAGKEQTCEDIFYPRKTADGYCCTFNYGRPSDDFGASSNDKDIVTIDGIERAIGVGLQAGLRISLYSNFTDYFYKTLPVLGFKVLIFSPLDFPDTSSGSLHEVIISPQTESSLTLEATSFYSVPEVQHHSVEIRDCLFKDELAVTFGGHYSYSDCIMYCRISDILSHCNCVPYFYPIPLDKEYVRTCNLKDLSCLKKYRNRWWRVIPRIENQMEPFNENFSTGPDGYLNCTGCLPACEDIVYGFSLSSAPLLLSEGDDTWGHGGCINSKQSTNHSIVNIFFQNPGTVRLKQDVIFYWWELMSNYGGICGFFLGVSLISVVELIYFFTMRLYKRKDEVTNGRKSSNFTLVKAVRPSLRPLYWEEMMQPYGKY
ncbi:sodium channel protein Nach-like [Neodiprion fabricii]|uniref:sodium channel protein Nach-like n=1 Tax=Neodiprion fabricii TaxID=2872261 RepID=UPI001ED94230|nr:sodium channel protein Nach-like [Neodiprion fabricii]